MSSKPSVESVGELRQLLHDFTEKRKEFSEASRYAAKLPKLQDELSSMQASIVKRIDEMDCKADGNWGWENRITWMLCELTSKVHKANGEAEK